MKVELNKILAYINENYEEQAIIRPSCLNYPYTIYIQAEKYDLEIKLIIPTKKHFLYGKCQFVLDFQYNANKKYRNELSWHGGGYADKYDEHNYSNIDEFLNEFCRPKEFKQISIFD